MTALHIEKCDSTIHILHCPNGIHRFGVIPFHPIRLLMSDAPLSKVILNFLHYITDFFVCQ